MLYTGCLSSICNESAICEFLTEESMSTSSSPSETDKKTDSIIDWIKKNAWQKPRAWFAKILQRLNHWAARIKAASQKSEGGEQSLWQKIKSKISSIIIWVTNKLESFVRPDKIGDKDNTNRKSMNNDQADKLGARFKRFSDFKATKPQRDAQKSSEEFKKNLNKSMAPIDEKIKENKHKTEELGKRLEKSQAESIAKTVGSDKPKNSSNTSNALNQTVRAINNKTGKEEDVPFDTVMSSKDYTLVF